MPETNYLPDPRSGSAPASRQFDCCSGSGSSSAESSGDVVTGPAGLVAWYKADSLSLNDNDPVGQWNDVSSNGNHLIQSSGAKKPTFKASVQNGLPTVRFVESQKSYMEKGSPVGFGGQTGQTIFWAGRTITWPFAAYAMIVVTDPAVTELRQLHQNPSTQSFRFLNNATEGAVTIVDHAIQERVVIGRQDDAANEVSVQVNVDGFQALTENANINGNVISVGGRSAADVTTTFDGDMYEIIIYNNKLTDVQTASIKAYLVGKWALLP